MFCDYIRAIGIYTGLSDNEIILEIEEVQQQLPDGYTPEDAALEYGRRMNVPMDCAYAICFHGRKFTDREIQLLRLQPVSVS